MWPKYTRLKSRHFYLHPLFTSSQLLNNIYPTPIKNFTLKRPTTTKAAQISSHVNKRYSPSMFYPSQRYVNTANEERDKLQAELMFEKCFADDQIRHQDDDKKALVNTLKIIAEEAAKQRKTKISVFLSHAWPDSFNDPYEELWTLNFTDILYHHLSLAGFDVFYDRENSLFEKNTNAFMKNILTSDEVILIGVRTLLTKHEKGTHNICKELNYCHLRRDNGKTVIPVIIAGNIHTSLPTEYPGYTAITNVFDEDLVYVTFLKKILERIFYTHEINIEDNLWTIYLSKEEFLPMSKSKVKLKVEANMLEKINNLTQAIKNKNDSQVLVYLENNNFHSLYNARTPKEKIPMLCLMIKYQLGPMVIDKLLSSGLIDINAYDVKGRTALFFAASTRDIETMEKLLQMPGVKIDCRTDNGITPFYETIYQGFYEGAMLLLDAGAKVDSEDRQGSTPLIAACFMHGNFKLIKLLVSQMTPESINHLNRDEQCALYKAIEQKREIEVIKLLVAHGADIHQRCGAYKHTPLHQAVAKGYVAAVAFLIKQGADVFAETTAGRRPIDFLPISPAEDSFEQLEIRSLLNNAMNATPHRDVEPRYGLVI